MPSVKLSVTVLGNLERKYDGAALKTIDASVKQWIAADVLRGITTVHVAVDDAKAMKALGAAPVRGRVTASKMKRAVDALWARLKPDYLVLFGGNDVVPYFVVDNPSYDPKGDDDRKVPTDNPYGCSLPYRASKRQSYLVPDRVIGRIPDAPSESDPGWLIDYLATATAWMPQERKQYAGAYAMCTDSWKKAGAECVQHFDEDVSRLMICPPEDDTAALPKSRLGAHLHMIKCHGAQIDPNFYGQKGNSYPVSLSSSSLKKKVNQRTVVGAMCCYGAQVFSPRDPAVSPAGAWPIASTYLRGGAYGMAGSTMIAWVGPAHMACADWIVAGYLKGVLDGASLGRAFLESKQDYVRWIEKQGGGPGIEDDKTLIEYVLLGDPSIQPVGAAPAPAIGRAGARVVAGARAKVSATSLQERRQRRVFRAQMATQIRDVLPTRRDAKPAAKARARSLYRIARDLMRAGAKVFRYSRSNVRVHRLETQFPAQYLAAAGFRPGGKRRAGAVADRRESYEYYWSGTRVLGGHRQIRLVKVETDLQGRVLRSGMVESS